MKNFIIRMLTLIEHHILQLLIALDQFLNVLLGGWADETLSSRAWRWHVNMQTSLPKNIIDKIFFWDKDHCKNSYKSERTGRHFPPELRRKASGYKL